MVPVSVSMIVRDEEQRLGAALESLSKLEAVDELVITDTGSIDATVDIARSHGARIFEERWRDDFSYHRNRCLDRCTNDWVLCLDGDEELVEVGDLSRFLEAPAAPGATLLVESVVAGRAVERSASLRVFDRRQARWRYPVHNRLEGIERFVRTTGLVHAHYDADLKEATRHRLSVLEHHHQQHPDDPHYTYYIAKAHVVLEQWREVLRWATRFIERWPDDPLAASTYTWAVLASLGLEEPLQASRLLDEGVARHPRFADLRHLQIALATFAWADSIVRPDPRYLVIPSTSEARLVGLGEAVAALGLPLQISEEGDTTGRDGCTAARIDGGAEP